MNCTICKAPLTGGLDTYEDLSGRELCHACWHKSPEGRSDANAAAIKEITELRKADENQRAHDEFVNALELQLEGLTIGALDGLPLYAKPI